MLDKFQSTALLRYLMRNAKSLKRKDFLSLLSSQVEKRNGGFRLTQLKDTKGLSDIIARTTNTSLLPSLRIPVQGEAQALGRVKQLSSLIGKPPRDASSQVSIYDFLRPIQKFKKIRKSQPLSELPYNPIKFVYGAKDWKTLQRQWNKNRPVFFTDSPLVALQFYKGLRIPSRSRNLILQFNRNRLLHQNLPSVYTRLSKKKGVVNRLQRQELAKKWKAVPNVEQQLVGDSTSGSLKDNDLLLGAFVPYKRKFLKVDPYSPYQGNKLLQAFKSVGENLK